MCRIPVWECCMRQNQSPKRQPDTQISTYTALQTELLRWMKMVVVWQHNRGVPHHVIAIVSALLISTIPLGLYNWLRDCWQQWPHVYPRLPFMPIPKQVANTPQPQTLHLNPPSMWNLDTFSSWQTLHVLWWGDKARRFLLISPMSSHWVSHSQSW